MISKLTLNTEQLEVVRDGGQIVISADAVDPAAGCRSLAVSMRSVQEMHLPRLDPVPPPPR